MEEGNKVIVYEDPITCQREEGRATITKVLHTYGDGYNDALGRQIYRCNVRFPKEASVHERDVSALA